MIAGSNQTLHPKTAPSALQAFHGFKATGCVSVCLGDLLSGITLLAPDRD